MRAIYSLMFIGVLGLGACSTTQSARRESVDDDVYYSRTSRNSVSDQNSQNNGQYNQNNGSYSQNGQNDQNNDQNQNGDQNNQNNQYQNTDTTQYNNQNQSAQQYDNSYDEYDYAGRINRFGYPSYGFGYYDPFYSPYWYNSGFNVGFGYGMGWGPYYGFGGYGGFGFGLGFGFGYGWGGYGYGGYYGGGYGGYYGGGYGHGYYGGGYNNGGYNNGGGFHAGGNPYSPRFRSASGSVSLTGGRSGYIAPATTVAVGRNNGISSPSSSVSRGNYLAPSGAAPATSGSFNNRNSIGYAAPNATNGRINNTSVNNGNRGNVFRSGNQPNRSGYYSPAQQVRSSNSTYNTGNAYGISRPNNGYNSPRFNAAPRSYNAPSRSMNVPSRSFSAPSRSFSAPSGGGGGFGGGGGGGARRGR